MWAGGPGGIGTSNSPLANLPEEIKLGNGIVKRPRITDLDCKWNINTCGEMILTRALQNMGADANQCTAVVNAILDWIDRDDQTRPEGAESDVYENFEPPYSAKNGPIDDISELLFIRGVTQELYLGLAATNFQGGAYLERMREVSGQSLSSNEIRLGLVRIAYEGQSALDFFVGMNDHPQGEFVTDPSP